MPTVGTGGVGTDTVSTGQFLQPAQPVAATGVVTAGPGSAFVTVTGDLGSLVGADYPTPVARHVVVRLDLAGGVRDATLPGVTVAADGTFTLAGIPSSSASGNLYQLSALWRTGIPGVPLQSIVLDRLSLTADTALLPSAAVPTFTLTGDLGDILAGADLSTATASLTADTPYVLESGEARFPFTAIPVAADGTFTLTGVPSSVTGAYYTFTVEAQPLARGVPDIRFSYGPFILLENGHIGLWSNVATDTFTGANGTDLDVHTADTGEAWTMTGGTLEIQGNALDNLSGHGFFPEGLLTLDTAYPAGVRTTVGYETASVSQVGVGSNYASTTYGGNYAFGVRVVANGTLETQAAGVDSLSLTGTLTGHPATGTIAVECVGTAITVYINGVAVATGTLPGTLLGTKAWLQLANADSTADNLVVRGRSESIGPPLATPPGPEPAWRANYGDAMPLGNFFTSTMTVSPGDSIYTAVEAAHAAAGNVVVLVEPGTYTDRIVGWPDVAIIGTTGNLADVLVQAVGSTEGGRWSPLNGSPAWVGGITFKLLSSTPPESGQYAFHQNAVAGLSVFEKCKFISVDATRNTALGSDVDAGARSYFIECEFDESTGTSSNIAINSHSTVPGLFSRVAFINCTSDAAVQWGDPFGTGNDDEFWWVGPSASAPYWRCIDAADSTLYLAPNPVFSGGELGTTVATVVRTNDLPTMPVYGTIAD